MIRCHRAEYTNREGQIYLKLNLMYNSAWSLFSADKEVAPEVEDQDFDFTYTPYAWSGYTYTFENIDRKSLDSIRTWNKKYFSDNKVIIDEMYTPLDEAEQEDGDFNILGKITQVVHRDNYMSDVRIQDKSNETWFATVSRRKFPRVIEGEIVKVRSATVDLESERTNTVKLSPHSNIMTIVPFSQLRKQLRTSVKANLAKVDKQLLHGKVIHEPILASTISKGFNHLGPDQVSSLNELTESYHRARFQVIACTSGKDAIVEVK